MKSRKETLATVQPIITALGGLAKVDNWGDITAEVEDCRMIIFTRGPRRAPSTVQVFSTVRCPESARLTRPFKLAKLIAKTLNLPVTFSAAGRAVSATINP